MSKEIVLSGIRPTGKLHLGNYFGALKNFVTLQNEYRCYFFIADYHALTTHTNPREIQESARNVLAEYLAVGIEPEKATLYLQSGLKQTTELYLLLNMHAYLGELERCNTFKEKARKQPQNVNAGLLTYPTLMAADILIHNAHYVPVGRDQEQHLEMARTFAKRFNTAHNELIFNEPQAFNFGNTLVKVPGLDGSGKMGKSEGNALYLSDSNDSIKKKVMKAVTDSGPTERNQKMPLEIENLFMFLQLLSDDSVQRTYLDAYNTCTIRYGALKKQLVEDAISFIEPIRTKIETLTKEKDLIETVLDNGLKKAQESADSMMSKIYSLYGY